MSPHIKCLIVNRDPDLQLKLLAQLNAHKEVQVLATVETFAAAAPLCRTLAPDLIFLDQALTEAETFAALPPVVVPPLIVALVTDEKEAIAALESHAIDYLLKPYTPQRLSQTIAKVRIHLAGRAVLSSEPLPPVTLLVKAFKVAGSSAPLLMKLANISVIKAEGDYCRITQDQGAPHIIRRTLLAWVKQLADSTFFRLDRFTLINLAHVVSYRRTSREHARLRIKGLKEPLLIGRRAILRLDQEYKARPPQFRVG
jgi:two-component system LytT family response regulator